MGSIRLIWISGALHDIPTSSPLFAPSCRTSTTIALIAPDLLGQGRTNTPRSGALDYPYAEHLGRFMDTVPPHQFDFVLPDFGGVLGLDWATQSVARLQSLIILSTTITGSFRAGKVLYAANLIFGQNLVRWGMQVAFQRPQKLEATLREEWVQPWSRRRGLRGTDHLAGHHLRRIRAGLHRIQVPVLVLWGEQDHMFPLRHARSIIQALPQAMMRTIERCGHWSILDAPEETAERMVRFLSVRGHSRT